MAQTTKNAWKQVANLVERHGVSETLTATMIAIRDEANRREGLTDEQADTLNRLEAAMEDVSEWLGA